MQRIALSLTLVLPALAFSTTAAEVQLVQSRVGDYVYTTGPGVSLTTTRISSYHYTNGTIGQRSFGTTATRIGSYRYINPR